MKTVGIIAEYNPFHRGHEYQIRQIRKQTGAEHVIIVMSGDFVQRGTPAWTDKFLRTEMALAGGADLVFELPVHFSTASAEGFAQGGVSLLDSLGFVDGICFGSECGNLEALSQIAHFLVAQDARIHTKIQNRLAEGYTYPAARAEILSDAFPDLLRQIPAFSLTPIIFWQ
ncbi:MAG: nucleotidyltransferase family protein [Eubacteriales bacterium]|nr:nucleotidyltransferase family protein [Eubacteriales bacterium]